LNFMGAAGMFAVSLYMIFMGGYYDRLLVAELPAGADLPAYAGSSATPEMANALMEAKKAAGPEIINATLIIPIILIVAFAGLFLYMRTRKHEQVQSLSNSIV